MRISIDLDISGAVKLTNTIAKHQQPHRKVHLIALDKETYCRYQSRRNQKRQKCLGSGRQQGSGTKHHSTQDEDKEKLIRQVALRV